MKSTEEIKNIIEAIMQGTDLFLVGLEVSPENSIEVLIDSMRGIKVEDCMSVSKQLESQLDRETEDFELTVSSAGIGYPFKVAKQYEKNLNKRVEVKLLNGGKLEGVLKAFTDQDIVVEVEEKVAIEGKKKKNTVITDKTIPFKEIKEVKDIVIF